MKNWYSRNFLVPEFSILQYSVWKFSVLGFYFPENSGIPIFWGKDKVRHCFAYLQETVDYCSLYIGKMKLVNKPVAL